jgi:hypothetical protein
VSDCVPASLIPSEDDRLTALLRQAIRPDAAPGALSRPTSAVDLHEAIRKAIEEPPTPQMPVYVLPPHLYARIVQDLGKQRFTLSEAMAFYWAQAEAERDG